MAIDAPLAAQPARTAPDGTGLLSVDAGGLKKITEADLVGKTPVTFNGVTQSLDAHLADLSSHATAMAIVFGG